MNASSRGALSARLLQSSLLVLLGAAGAAALHALPIRSALAAEGAGRQVIVATDAPKAVGPYSQGVRAGNLVFVAGQLPLDPKTSALVEGGIEPQTRRVLDNVKAILAADGLTMKNVVMSNCYLKTMDDFAKFNAIYATYFPDAPPARATVAIAGLAKDAIVEVAVIAVR